MWLAIGFRAGFLLGGHGDADAWSMRLLQERRDVDSLHPPEGPGMGHAVILTRDSSPRTTISSPLSFLGQLPCSYLIVVKDRW